MRFIKLTLVAAAAALALGVAACSQKSGALAPVKTDIKTFEAELAALPNEHYVLKATGAADIAAVVAAAPKSVKVTYATVTFDAASGTTVINQLRIAPADQPDVGVSIDQLKVWGLDTKAAIDRLTGLNLDKTVRLANRVEAAGITPFGLDKYLTPAMEAYSGAITDAVVKATGDGNPEVADAMAAARTSLKGYDIGIEHILVDDLYLRPWALVPAKLPADSQWAAMMPVLQGYAAAYHAFSLDRAVVSNMKVAMTFEEASRDISMSMLIGTMGVRGWRGGDVDISLMRNMKVDMQQPLAAAIPPAVADPATGPAVTPQRMSISEVVERAYTLNMRADKAMGYLARGQMPPRTETDLLGFGVTTLENMSVDINGHKVFTFGKIRYDLSKFYWLIPVKGQMSAENFAYDIPGLMDFIAETSAQSSEPGAAPVAPIPPAILPVLAKYGMDKPSFDTDFAWDWNPKTGATHVSTAFGIDGYDRVDAAADLTLPTFDAVSALIPENGKADDAALSALFEKVSALTSASFNLKDEGGLDKIFPLIIEIANAMPADDPSMGPLRALTPEGLRGMASSGAYMLADQAATGFPAARDLLRPFAAWVTEGGAVHAAMKPKAPVVFSAYGEQVSSGALAPEKALEPFNLTVTHEPPKGAAKKPN